MNAKAYLLAALLTSSTLGCGGDSSSPTPGLSGVPSDKTGGELDEEEALKFCQWRLQRAKPVNANVFCTELGLDAVRTRIAAVGTSPDGCEVQRMRCLEDFGPQLSMPTPPPDPSACPREYQLPSDCDATVSDMESCLETMSRDKQAYEEGLTCKDVDKPKPGLAEICAEVDKVCPELFFRLRPREFSCGTPTFGYNREQACDGVEQCPDGADESNCD